MSQKPKLIKLESAEKYQKLFDRDSGTSGMKSGHVILQSGENIGEHSTGEREEALVILKGKGEAVIGKGGIFDIEKDTVLYIPPQTGHDIKNTGLEILEYIFIVSNVRTF